MPRAAAVSLLAAAAAHSAAATGTWALQKLDLTRFPFATCLDGSPGAFYVMNGSAGPSNDWVLHLQGGGWCTSLEDCADRAAFPVYADQPSIGSTTAWGPGPCTAALSNSTPPCVADGGSGGIQSNNASVNPLLHSANKVWLGYCDGGSFAGTVTQPVAVNATTRLFFRGAFILHAIMTTLLTDFGMATASSVVLSGCSAGGVAAYIHADHVRDMIAAVNPTTRYVAAPGAGFIMDIPSYEGQSLFAGEMQWVSAAMATNGSGNAACVNDYHARLPGQEWRCMVPAVVLQYIGTPLFVSNSIGDAAQLYSVMNLPCNPANGNCNASELAYFDAFRQTMIDQLAPVVDNSTNGAWLVECVVHMVQNVDGAWNQILVAGQTQAETFAAWYTGDHSVPSVAIDVPWTSGSGKPFGGNPMCGDYGPVPSLP